jgi:molybdopterin-guanine dinucleotide biosynthesis protein A
MGHDKSVIQWHGKEQRYHMADMLAELCEDVYISCRADQQSEMGEGYKALPDSVNIKGPMAGIASAFNLNPDAAWLVVACDLPLLDVATLRFLLSHRDASKIATAFMSSFDGMPEPLIAIWEPQSRAVLQAAMMGGASCPRKILIKNEEHVAILVAPNGDALLNANTPEDADRVKAILEARV